jgi:hypothetical protein
MEKIDYHNTKEVPHDMQILEHKRHLEHVGLRPAHKLQRRQLHAKVAHSEQEASHVTEIGFEYIREKDGLCSSENASRNNW